MSKLLAQVYQLALADNAVESLPVATSSCMRILHVVPSYLPAVRYGGPIFAVHGLCRALAARGHEVQVFTTNIDGPGVTSTPIATPVDLDDVQIQYFPCPLLRRLYWSPALGRALHREVDKFDIDTRGGGSCVRRMQPFIACPMQ